MSSKLSEQAEIPNGGSLVAQLRPALVKFFRRRTSSGAEAEDLAQDVIVSALAHARWKSEGEARGYIFRSAMNRWRDRHRRRQAQGVPVAWDEVSALERGAENSPERVLIGKEDLNGVVQVLRKLDQRSRAVLILVRLEKMKIASVAESLGVSVRTVNNDLSKALSRLAQLRERKEPEHETPRTVDRHCIDPRG